MNKFVLNNFNLIASFLNLWLIGGLFLDGWAHAHIKGIDSFFTPWHGVYFGGFFAVGMFLYVVILINFLKKRDLKNSIPAYYIPAFLGVILFGLGGVGDAIWHTFFGFEVSIEALISPTHLTLFLGLFMIFISPFNSTLAAYKIRNKKNWKNHISLILSAAIFFSYLTFLTEYINPLISPFAFNTHKTNNYYYGEAIGLASLFVQNSFFIGTCLYVIKKTTLPIGFLLYVLLINAVAMTNIHDHYDFIISAFLAGILSEIILFLFKPSLKNSTRLQIFSFLIPSVYTACYFLVGNFTRGIWWTPHLWVGSIFITGFFGWLLSALALGFYNKN
jgi:hypothetical protein